jgi:hypothetical protein
VNAELVARLAIGSIGAVPVLASLVCWFGKAPLSAGVRLLAGAHGVLFVASYAAAVNAPAVTGRHLSLVVAAGFAGILLVALTSAVAALVLHRHNAVAMVVLVLALPIEAVCTIGTVAGLLGINTTRMGAP